jgi:protocatechuate 3,4-dioxygenase beta subunit
MDNDDKPVGKVLSRRQALRLLGVAGGAAGAGLLGERVIAQNNPNSPTALPSCVVRPALTEGPYFVDERLNRSDIRTDSKTGTIKAGLPLTLTFLVSTVGMGKCEPRSGVMVDVWHCDAQGAYSDVSDRSFNTQGQDFLRGYQITDASGKATFSTIYPGWYPGRAVHIHFKLRTVQGGSFTGEFTSQLFFDEAVTDAVHARAPYDTRGRRTTLNQNDSIYRNGGNQMLLSLKGSPTTGYAATFDVGLNIA